VITIDGVCPPPKTAAGTGAKTATAAKPATKPASAADCKTIITRAEFEKMVNALSPTPLGPPQKKQLAASWSRSVGMSDAAKKKGLDKTSQYKETIKFYEMQILSRQLSQNIQEEAGKIPHDEIEAYYKDHLGNYEQFDLERLFVPRMKQMEPEAKEKEEEEKNEKPSEEAQKAKQDAEKAKADEAAKAMTDLAENLRTRAAAGEDFVKLQKEAFDAAGMKIESPTVTIPPTRRTGLPPAHAVVFDLKAGEVSQVINDSGGHYVYKMKSREQLPLDQKLESEIHNTLQNQRSREMMDKITNSFKVETNDAYFGPGGAPMMPPPGMPNRMPPRPMAPTPQPQTPPPAQPPAAPKPN
jgi:hypothetical protein